MINLDLIASLLAASKSVQRSYLALLATGNVAAAKAAHEAGEAIARCIGLVVLDSNPAAVQP